MKWMETCKTEHQHCNHPKTHPTWLPTRLLIIDNIGSERKVRLIETGGESSQLEYMALSHCWGLKSIITLTALSEQSLKQGVSLVSLPRTFRDAFEIIEWFGIQYIWIDSLCILQDSAEDWQREASSMKDVYKNAVGTIAATGAIDSSVGCFFARDPDLVKGFCITTSSDEEDHHELFCFGSDIWTDGVDQAPLNQRAWVVQERLLSRRVLHFSNQQIFWECHELNACETFPKGLEPMVPDISIGFKNLHTACTSEMRLAPQWERVTRAYTRAALTKTTDKIIALAGIADEMQSVLSDKYLAGLWARNLPEQLVWQVVGDKEKASRPPSYRAPSWSWLSIDAAVEPASTFNDSVLVEILSANVEPVPGRESSHIKTGFIRLRGVLTNATWRRSSLGSNPNESLTLLFNGRELHFSNANLGTNPMLVNLDDLQTSLPDTIYCLPIVPQRYGNLEGIISVEGLLLHVTAEMNYQRIGYFRIMGREACEVVEQGPRVKTLELSPQGREKWAVEHLPMMELTLI